MTNWKQVNDVALQAVNEAVESDRKRQAGEILATLNAGSITRLDAIRQLLNIGAHVHAAGLQGLENARLANENAKRCIVALFGDL